MPTGREHRSAANASPDALRAAPDRPLSFLRQNSPLPPPRCSEVHRMSAVAKSISCNAVERRRKSVTPLNDVPRDAMIHGMPDLLAALRTRRDELQLTHE